jgi:hypothetical protein
MCAAKMLEKDVDAIKKQTAFPMMSALIIEQDP